MDQLLEAFDRTCQDQRHRLALWSRGEKLQLDFATLAARSRDWEAAVAGLECGVVALACGNGTAFVELFFALRRRGLPVALMDGGLPFAEKARLCARLGVRELLHRDACVGSEAWPGSIQHSRFDAVETTEPAPGTAVVKLTSGSTGEPLGLCLTAQALVTGIQQIATGMAISATDRVLVAIPLSHSYGFDNGVSSLAVVGTPLVLEPGFYPSPLLAALAEGDVTFFPAVPPMVRALADSSWPGELPLRRVISAGGPLAPEFAARFRERSGLAVHQFYGSSETGGICFESDPSAAGAAGTVGFPLPGVEVELLDPGAEDDAAMGTVAVRSAANFLATLGGTPRSDRRVILGDRGAWQADGRLRLVGRCSDLLNVAGRRVSATAIETCLRQLPGIDDAAVVAVADAVRGDRVLAFLVGKPQPCHASSLPAGLARRDLRYIEALPYTDRGKLDRTRLGQWAREKV